MAAGKTVKVRMLQSIAGPDLVAHPGDEVALEAAEAKRVLEAGLAEPVATRGGASGAEKRG